jgi:2-hydroxy-3-keto-5-methylthiopentenyl-1-phosphate phosphatase
MATPIEIYCDFDGTITIGDTTDELLEALADPAWVEIEKRWEKGEIGSRDCMAQQVALIRGGWGAVQKVLDKVEIEPTFPKFASWCRRVGIPLRIVSDGLDRAIQYLLAREKIRVDFVWANRLQEGEDGAFSLLFPYSVSNKVCSSGVCKCNLLESKRGAPLRVVIGDGRSDFCWAPEADLLFAKSKLAQHCAQEKIEYHQFDDFLSIKSVLTEHLHKEPSTVGVPVFLTAS